MLNLDLARLMHKHGDDWVAMNPVADHSPDARDPERRLLRNVQVYRCEGCDEEIQFHPAEVPR